MTARFGPGRPLAPLISQQHGRPGPGPVFIAGGMTTQIGIKTILQPLCDSFAMAELEGPTDRVEEIGRNFRANMFDHQRD